jgi:putative ABC transport system substrate-binding protein
LADVGYIEGKNVEYRGGHNDRRPSLIAELVGRQVSVIVTLDALGARRRSTRSRSSSCRAPTQCRPRRESQSDIKLFLAKVAAKRLEFLLVLVPGVRSVAYLRNPTNSGFAESETRGRWQAASRSFGMQVVPGGKPESALLAS